MKVSVIDQAADDISDMITLTPSWSRDGGTNTVKGRKHDDLEAIDSA